MRIPAVALLALLTCPCMAAAADAAATAPGAAGLAVAMEGFSKVPGWAHPLEHSIPAESWRGKRVRLTLSLSQDEDARLNVALLIAKQNGVFLTALPRSSRVGGDGRQTLHFVMDVPEDAAKLAVRVNMGGKGMAWLDNINFEAVGADVPVSVSRRETDPSLFDGPIGSYSFGNNY